MKFSDYEELAIKTNQYPKEYMLTALILGLVGESGEVADKYKKYLRGDFDGTTDKTQADFQFEMRNELGDVLWYIANIANELGLTLEHVAVYNIAKLQSRKQRNVIKGDGDNR